MPISSSKLVGLNVLYNAYNGVTIMYKHKKGLGKGS